MKEPVLKKLAAFAAELQYEQLPPEVISKANDCFFDFVACYYGALKNPGMGEVLRQLAGMNPKPQSRIWGTEFCCGIAEASLAMGTVGYTLEYDDGISVAGHWGSASIPATALAVADHGGNGKNLIAGIVAAYEVGTRISRLFAPRLLKRHTHFPCTMGAFGAATGYAKGSGCSQEVITGALSLAGLFPLGTYSTATAGAQGKALYSGWPNYLGVNAVRLSEIGLRGDADILENPDGLAGAMGFPPLTEDMLQGAVEGLGKKWRFMEVYFKPYPCCRWLHAPVHALLELMEEHQLRARDVVKIQVGGPEFLKMYDTKQVLKSKVACQYSIPFAVGSALYYGKLGVKEFSEDARKNLDIQSFIDRISVYTDPELQRKFPASFSVKLEVFLTNGRLVTAEAGTPWGPDAPPTKEELINKFRMLTDGILTEQERKEWKALYLQGFDTSGNFEEMLRLCADVKHLT